MDCFLFWRLSILFRGMPVHGIIWISLAGKKWGISIPKNMSIENKSTKKNTTKINNQNGNMTMNEMKNKGLIK